MKLFGLEFSIARVKATPPNLQHVHSQRGWWPVVRESFAGAWQRNIEITLDNVSTHTTVFACATLTANDVAKMRLRLVQQDNDGIWNEIEIPAFTPVLRKPNDYQDRIQFFVSWVLSKQFHGNTYALKVRDNRNVVQQLHVLDPCRVCPLVAPDGSVYYQLKTDSLAGLPADVIVPASEIIHDRHNTIFHPLVGLSPLYAAGLPAIQGLNIQRNQTTFFGNGASPGGVLTAPGAIDQATALRVKEYWESEFTGENSGKVAVLGDGLKFEKMPLLTAVDSDIIKQLNLSSEQICSAFHIPPYMVGVGPYPSYNNVEALNRQYYSQCLQILIESIESCLDFGLGLREGENLTKRYGTEFDVDDLLRMDGATMMEALDKGRNYLTPDEGRKKLNLSPVPGGDAVYRQQQDFSLEALQKRDAKPDPFAKEPATPAPTTNTAAEEEARLLATWRMKAYAQLKVAA